jgi:hypothetical protein
MITPEYKSQLVELHKKQRWGAQGWKCMPDVLSLIIQYRLKQPKILDYGAGERTFEHTARWALPQARVTSYDPGIPEIDQQPTLEFDIVVCTDVLEHIEPQFVDATLGRLRYHTLHAAHLCIACTPAKTLLPDGRNAHLVVQPPEWWLPKIQSRWAQVEVIKASKLLIVNAHA